MVLFFLVSFAHSDGPKYGVFPICDCVVTRQLETGVSIPVTVNLE